MRVCVCALARQHDSLCGRALCEFAGRRKISAAAHHHRQGRAIRQSGQAAIEAWVVGFKRAASGHNCVVGGPQHVADIARQRPCNPRRFTIGGSHEAVFAHGQFERDMRAPATDARQKTGIYIMRYIAHQPFMHFNSGLTQFFRAAPCNPRVGVVKRKENRFQTRRHQRIGARGGLAGMRARLQRDISRAAARCIASFAKGFGFGVRASAALRPARADNRTIGTDNNAADRRVGARHALPAQSQTQSLFHEMPVFQTGIMGSCITYFGAACLHNAPSSGELYLAVRLDRHFPQKLFKVFGFAEVPIH